ncbi:glycosyltransferase family 39 protein [Candidatus Parcubacteria bacterium]|nr:glycosyltransferase family 39 protein [Candidatus Parcubacteria bacterium]
MFKERIKEMENYKIFLVLAVVTFISTFFWTNIRFFDISIQGDSARYVPMAIDYLENGTLTIDGEDTYTEPLYPLFIAVLFKISNNSVIFVKIVQVFLYALSSILLYKILLINFTKLFSFLSAFLFSIYYGFANYAGSLHREMLFTFLIIITAFFLFKKNKKYYDYFFIGLFLGLGTLVNASLQYVIFFIILNFIFIFYKKITFIKLTKILIITIFGFILILSPWLIYTSYKNDKINLNPAIAPRTGRILAFRTYFMEKVYNNYPKYLIGHIFGYYFIEKFDNDFDIRAFRNFQPIRNKIDELKNKGILYYEMDSMLTKEAADKIIANPHKYLLMSILDFINLNNPMIPQRFFGGNNYIHFMFAEGRWPQIPEYVKILILLFIRLIWYTFLFFVVYGILKSIKKWDKISWFLIFIIYFNIVYSLLHAIPRYVQPVYPFYFVFALIGVSFMWDKISTKDYKVFNI